MSGVLPTPRTFGVSEFENAASLNSLRDALNFLLDPPHFKGSFGSGVTLATGTNLAYPVIEDNYAGWDGTNHRYVVPAGCGGLYVAVVQFKWNATPPASAPSAKILGGASNATAEIASPAAPSTAAVNGFGFTGFVRCNAGDQISVQLAGASFVTQNDSGADNAYFEFFFYAK